ncbi:MAG: protein kinase [Pseudomonadota bacterium]
MTTAPINNSQVLPSGYTIGKFEIEKEIGAGGFGITYKAFDTVLRRHVAIKEYFPFNLAARGHEFTVAPKTQVAGDVEEYEWGLARFLEEAQALAMFNHPNIIHVIDSIEHNDTAYIIMEFADGPDLSAVLKEKSLTETETEHLITAVASGLVAVHESALLHRDIKPGNIIVRADGSPVLIDFGAARQAIGVKSQSLSTILTPGYAPIEQYSSRGDQGAWTDIYSLAAVGYVCLTRQKMSNYEATDRIRGDDLPKLAELADLSGSDFLRALDWGMAPEERDRPQSVTQWLAHFKRPLLGAETSATQDASLASAQADDEALPDEPSTDHPAAEHGGQKFNWAMVAALFIVVGIVGFFAFLIYSVDQTSDVVTVTAPQKRDASEAQKAGQTEAQKEAQKTEAESSKSEPAKPAVIKKPVDKAPPRQSPVQEKPAQTAPAKPPQRVARVPQQKEPEKPKATPDRARGRTPQPNPAAILQDKKDFETAQAIATPDAFEIYLRLHPNGQYKSLAEARLR